MLVFVHVVFKTRKSAMLHGLFCFVLFCFFIRDYPTINLNERLCLNFVTEILCGRECSLKCKA